MPHIENTTTITTATSKPDQSSELAALNARKANLEGRQAGWEIALSIALLVTALAAFLVFVFNWRVRRSSKAIQEVQDEIIRAKDAELRLSLGEKDLKIAEANRLAADANKATEDERAARVELEDRVAWRTFSGRQKKEFKANLGRFSGQLADCSFLSSDTEAFAFSSEIAAGLRTAQWQVVPPNPYVMTMKATSLPNSASPIEKIDFGVEVQSTSDATEAAHAVAEELNKLGFDAYFKPSTQRPQPPCVWITVQHRPLGPQGDAKLRAQKAKKQ